MTEVNDMKDFINFVLDSIDQTEDLKKLQSLLENTGIEAKITTNASGEKPVSFLNIVYDDEVVRTKKKRNAGRHYVGHVGRYTVGEIKKMQETMTNKEIAALLCISERTLYRRLKDKINSVDSDEFI